MIVPPRPQDRLDTLLRAVSRRRILARFALWFERAWPAVWPVLGVAGVWLCLALLDLPRRLPGWAHAWLLGGFALALGLAVWRAARGITVPAAEAADRRMERASGLSHRPLAVLTDRPVQAGADALWMAHVVRAMGQVGRLRVGLPRPGMAGHDPRALRLGLVVGLAACLGIAGEQAPGRVMRGFVPVFGAVAAPAATQVQAWITPPAYTGQAPVFLKPEGGAVSVPRDSRLVVNVTGGTAVPMLTQGARALAVRALDATSFQAEETLADSGRLALMREGRELAGWDLTVVPNLAPEVRFPEPPGGLRARVPQTRFPWEVAHAYGVVGLQAELTLRDRPEASALVVPIQLPGGSTKAAKGARVQDLTAHPWAGTMVEARLVGRDATGLEGHSETIGFELPERRFQHPVARALIAQRKALTLRPDERGAVVAELDRLGRLDEVWKDDPGGFLNLEGITRQLRHDRVPGAVEEAQGRMWQLALHLEEGAAERTARALEQARRDVRETLEAERRGEEVDRAELDRRMRELQEALQRHMEALAEQARRDPGQQTFDPERQNRLDAQDMKRATEEMRDAAREERMQDARDKMAELERMLEEMKNARQERGKPTERQKARQEKRERGERQMSAVQDMIRREGTLVDNAQQRGGDAPAPRPFMAPRPPPRGLAPEDPQRAAAQRAQDQKVQQALRRALGELMQQQGDLTGKIPAPLAEADAAMRDAVQALRDGRDPAAGQAAQRAIEALQKGRQEMSSEMAAQFGRGGEEDGEEEGEESGEGSMMAEGDQEGMGNGPGSQQMGPGGDQRADRRGDRGLGRGRYATRRADERRDPLGRHLREGTSGSDESGDVQVPEQMEEARTRAIQEELRRRAADRGRAQSELEYIDRLLKQF